MNRNGTIPIIKSRSSNWVEIAHIKKENVENKIDILGLIKLQINKDHNIWSVTIKIVSGKIFFISEFVTVNENSANENA